MFFERMKTLRDEWPKIFRTDTFPREVRIQCWSLCNIDKHKAEPKVIELRRSLGIERLSNKGKIWNGDEWYHEELKAFFFETPKVEYAFTVLELISENQKSYVIAELNNYLRKGGIGYKLINNKLTPVTDENLMDTAMIPVISILNQFRFQKAYKHLQDAFDNYARGGLETSIDETMKAVEALLKTIFDELQIPYTPQHTYMPLVELAKENGLLLDTAVDQNDKLLVCLAKKLKILGAIRNKGGGHGDPNKEVPPKLVRFAIHHAVVDMLYVVETFVEK